MKRSSTVARLTDDPQQHQSVEADHHYHNYHTQSISKWNYQEDILATSMMLATISDDKDRRFQTRRSGSMGSNVSSGGSMSRCSSRSSLSGWGSATSRKSYKVDLCSLADRDPPTNQYHVKSVSVDSGGGHEGCDVLPSSVVPDTVEDVWGFFVDSNI
jgi:hypothetical protein